MVAASLIPEIGSSDPNSSPQKRRRGRPRNEDRRNVSDALLAATESLLSQNGLGALTEREIARVADVSETVIPYYFGDKNGLLFALADRNMAFIDKTLHSLMDIDPCSPTASRQIAETMIRAHHTYPSIGYLMIFEQQRRESSPIWKQFAERRGPRSLVQIRTALLYHAKARHPHVTSDLDHATRMALSLMCITAGTLSFHTLSTWVGIGLEDMRRDPWLQHVSNLVDFHLDQLSCSQGQD